MINYTHAFPGSVAPTRSGWFPVDPHQRAHFDTGTGAWSEAVDEDASDDAHRSARATRMSPERAAALRWSGLTADSHAWLAAELARP
jgi:hypothetical protein